MAQTSLSGKAASRMQEVTGMEGYTIHRLLSIDAETGMFVYNENNKLSIDLLIIDEISMLGGILFYQLLKAIPDNCKLVMVGDMNQLEAIGKLNVLKDMIQSKVLNHINLTQIHRQALKSAIVTESAKVRNHEQLTSESWTGMETRGELQDFVIHCYKDKDISRPTVLHHFKQEFTRLGSSDHIQILTARRDGGDISAMELNNAIQEIANPPHRSKTEVEIRLSKDFYYTLRLYDKIMIYKNNYKTYNLEGKTTPVFNGWVGKITEIDLENQMISVYFDIINDTVIFEKKNWNKILLGYASTVHKFQGSQEEVIILAFDFSGFLLLTKELIYTGITRASDKLILVAETSALKYAISHSNITTKQTFLCTALKELQKEEEEAFF
jgi:exodeoxyribonuclease V alpha subunit